MYRGKRLKDLPENLRPREKLIKHGADSLTQEELLAIILGSGSKSMDVFSLSQEIVKLGWDNLHIMRVEEIERSLKGIGQAKACQIKALIELSKRINDPYQNTKVSSPEDVYKLVRDKFNSRKEHLIALFLSPSNRLLDMETVAIGRMNSLYADPKDILHTAVKVACSNIIVVHNHPKGELKPSKEDVEFTKRLDQACKILGFDLLDHLIVNEMGYVSLKALGYL